MDKARIRFYIPSGIVTSTEFKQRVTIAGCDRFVAEKEEDSYVEYSHDFLHLQPSSFISDNLLKYLNANTSKVTLFVRGVPNVKMIKGLQPKAVTINDNEQKEFHLQFGKRKISGKNCRDMNWAFDLLIEGKISKDVFETFQSFAPGYFPQSSFIPINNFLEGMNFFKRFKLVFGW